MPLYLFCLIELHIFIWDFELFAFEVGGYDKIENFLKTILKLTIETTFNSS